MSPARQCFLRSMVPRRMFNIALVAQQRSRIRELIGFRKNHRVPDEHSERSRSFVRRIAADDIGKDLDQRFDDLRRQLQLKRVDMQVADPHDGTGSITTPHFRYQVSVVQSHDDPSAAVWRRQLSGFSAVDSVLSDELAAAFGTLFDTVEFTPADPIDVEAFIDWIEQQPDSRLEPDYDRTGTWCRLLAPQQQSSAMLVEHHQVSLQSLTPCSPATLVNSFLAFQKLLPSVAWTG